jgi:hypothetical protein
MISNLHKIFLYALGGYWVIILNQHFNTPLKFIPWALIALATFLLIADKNLKINALTQIFRGGDSRWLAVLLISVLGMTLFFFMGSIKNLPNTRSLFDFLTIYLGPILLGVLAAAIIPKKMKSLEHLLNFCVIAILFLAVTELLHYLREIYRFGAISKNHYIHRWFADGYLFFLPFLLVKYIKTDCRKKKYFYLFGISSVVLFVSIIASRAATLILIFQLIVTTWCFRSKKLFFGFCVLILITTLAAFIFTPWAMKSVGDRLFLIINRFNDALIPGYDGFINSLWLGNGFGSYPWNHAYEFFLSNHPNWVGVNTGHSHNFFLEIAFIGGIFALCFGIVICIIIVKKLLFLSRLTSSNIEPFAFAILLSFFSFYIFRGIVEAPRWEPLGIVITWFFLLYFTDLINANKKARPD